MIHKALSEYPKNSEIASVVTAISSDKYQVNINGNNYWVKDGIHLHPAIGTAVWVRTPNGTHNMNDAYICAGR